MTFARLEARRAQIADARMICRHASIKTTSIFLRQGERQEDVVAAARPSTETAIAAGQAGPSSAEEREQSSDRSRRRRAERLGASVCQGRGLRRGAAVLRRRQRVGPGRRPLPSMVDLGGRGRHAQRRAHQRLAGPDLPPRLRRSRHPIAVPACILRTDAERERRRSPLLPYRARRALRPNAIPGLTAAVDGHRRIRTTPGWWTSSCASSRPSICSAQGSRRFRSPDPRARRHHRQRGHKLAARPGQYPPRAHRRLDQLEAKAPAGHFRAFSERTATEC